MISLDKIAKINVFKIPINYFENLNAAILRQTVEAVEIQNQSAKKMPFSMPEGYFDTLSAKIMGRIEQAEKKNISLEDLEKVNIFKVPENYFQELELNTNIERFGKANIYKVPDGYFDGLSKNILSNIAPKEAKVININWWQTQKIRWSAAASVILMAGLWFGIAEYNKDKTKLALEKVSNEEIKTYLETQDLSYLEYESSTEAAQNTIKPADNKVLDGLNLDKQAILEHLENQDLEEEI